MLDVYVNGVGVLGPGLPNWDASRAVLLGNAAHDANALPQISGSFLPATERRRAGRNTRLAVEVAREAVAQAGIAPHEAATVFASSSADTEVIHAICETLANPDPAERLLSPTRFHNSVHNAAAGYWCIAAGSHLPSTSIACYDKSVAAGLLEAATQAVMEDLPVLLVVYETPYPEPLARVQPTGAAFGAALVLTRTQVDSSMAHLALRFTPDGGSHPHLTGSLETLRRGNFAARILPLLRALAGEAPASVTLAHSAPHGLRVECMPCR
jgi:hypothetical protein